jgi:hypothetical protein
MRNRLAVLVIPIVILAGCATASKDIASSYVSPLQYKDFDCEQIQAEAMRVSAKSNQIGGRLDQAASNDKAITGVGAILFWPALFALGGTKQQEAEYSHLEGEYDALQQQAVAKKCVEALPPLRTPKPATDEKKSDTATLASPRDR